MEVERETNRYFCSRWLQCFRSESGFDRDPGRQKLCSFEVLHGGRRINIAVIDQYDYFYKFLLGHQKSRSTVDPDLECGSGFNEYGSETLVGWGDAGDDMSSV
jgi:hypothetical protein